MRIDQTVYDPTNPPLQIFVILNFFSEPNKSCIHISVEFKNKKKIKSEDTVMLCLALPLSLSKFENGVFFFLYLFSLHTLFEFEILNSTEISNANHKKASLLSSSSSSSFTESFSSSQQQQQCHHRFCWNTLLPWTASYLLLFFASSFQVLLFGFEILVELKFCFFFSVMICFMGFFFF